MRKQHKIEENIKITAVNPPKSCLDCMFFGIDIDDPNGTCLLTGHDIDLDAADKRTMSDCKIKKRKWKRGKATREEKNVKQREVCQRNSGNCM